jgi:hypothetical protein
MSKSVIRNFQSLRAQAEKWLAAGSDTPLHVRLFGRTPTDRRRYVCIEALRPSGACALFFFRHDDGNWRVFPRATPQPMMAPGASLPRY